MTLLAPLFLLGLLGIGLPLWLHRLQTKNPQRTVFASAMLLEPHEQRLHVQRRLRYLLLLGLRIGLLALLAFAFAQPVLKRSAAAALGGAGPQLRLIVVDTSMSMRADGRFRRARAEARRLIDTMGPLDRAEVVAAGASVTVLGTPRPGPSADKSALRSALAALQPGDGRLDYGAAISALGGILGGVHGRVSVHFISDFQASGVPARFAELVPRPGPRRQITLRLDPVASGAVPNWAVEGIVRQGDGVNVSVRGFGTPARSLTVRLQINGAERASLPLALPASGAATVHFPGVTLASGDNRVRASIEPHDALAFDDTGYAVLRNQPPEPVPLLTTATDSRAVRYVSAALQATGGHFRVVPEAIASFDGRALPRYRWVIVPDLGAIGGPLAGQLRSFLNNGGAALAGLGPQAAPLGQLAVTGDTLGALVAAGEQPLTVGQIDAADPLLAGQRGWGDLSIGRMLALQPRRGDRVLLGASNGDALLLERRIGRGRLLLFTSGLDNDWNDLPVEPVFVSFLAQAAAYLDGRAMLPRARTVGESLSLAGARGASGQVIDPSGRTLVSLAGTRVVRSVKLAQAGFYRVYTPEQEAWTAVNVDPRESDLTPMGAQVLARWRAAASPPRSAGVRTGAPARAASYPLRRLLLPLLALLVLVESLVGDWHLDRRARAVT